MFPLPPSLYLKAAGVLLVLASVAGMALWLDHRGAARVQAKWDAFNAEAAAKAEAAQESDRLRAKSAALTYEAQRDARAIRASQPSQEASNALHATICPKPGVLGQPLELGDLPIPAAVLLRLRDAGADYTGH